MSDHHDQLVSMGFEESRIAWALKATRSAGLQQAMDHLLANSEKPVPEADDEDEPMDQAGGDAEAKSIKCEECDKIFKNTALANFHAEKSGHQSFSESTEEIKPLTEEEKRQKLDELRANMAAKRAVKQKQEAEENKANEALRRKSGKESNEIREQMKLKEANKEALARKKEKEDDARARAAIKAQIELDKKARAERTAREKAIRDGGVVDVGTGASASVAKPVGAIGGAGKDYPETRLQARLPGGAPPITKTLPSSSTLQDVAEWLASESLAVTVDSVAISTRFPNRSYSRAEFGQSLKELGLTPSAVLFIA